MRTIIGVMGSGSEDDEGLLDQARELGRAIAQQGWVLLNGGRDRGVMDASAQGAHAAGGLVVGVLPDDDAHRVSPWVDIPIRTGMGDARNVINVLSSDVVIAMRGGAGTVSEIALALKACRPVVLLDRPDAESFAGMGHLIEADTVEEAVVATWNLVQRRDA